MGEFKFNFGDITQVLFVWVLYAVGINLGLYALGLVGINFATFFGSFVLAFVLSQLIASTLIGSLTVMAKDSAEEEEG